MILRYFLIKQREISLIVKDIEFENKKLTELEKIIRDKSGRYSTTAFPPSEATMHNPHGYSEPNIFGDSRRDEGKMLNIIKEEMDVSQIQMRNADQ